MHKLGLTVFQLFNDGTTYAEATDNSCYHLSPSGQMIIENYTTISYSTHANTIAKQLLDFRNCYCSNAPFLCTNLLSESDLSKIVTLSYPLRHARWPAIDDVLFHYNETTKNTSITSIDKTITLELEMNRFSFSITYPTHVMSTNNPNTYDYLWIEQKFSIFDAPVNWRYPLFLLLNKHGDPVPAYISKSISEYIQPCKSYISIPIPIDETRVISSSSSTNLEFTNKYLRKSRTKSHAKPVILVEWNSIGLYRNLSNLGDSNYEMCVTLHSDSTFCVVSDFCKFITLYSPQHVSKHVDGFGWRDGLSPVGEMYCSDVGYSARNDETNLEYKISSIVSRAIEIFYSSHNQIGDEKKGVKRKTSVGISEKIEIKVDNCGTFYAHGNEIKAVFDDRTLVTATLDGELAHVTTRNGQVVIVRLVNPIGNERYISAVLNFRTYILSTPNERRSRADDWRNGIKRLNTALAKNEMFLNDSTLKKSFNNKSSVDVNSIKEKLERNKQFIMNN